MHYLIGVIVYGKNKEEAFDEAKELLDNLCGDYKAFDYYSTADDSFSRWKGQKVIRVNCKKGKELVTSLMKYTEETFFETLEKVKKALDSYTSEELFEEKDKEMFRYRCSCLGQYEGHEIHLYDTDGAGIRNNKHLKNVLSKWKCLGGKYPKKYADMNIYIVPADVHT